MIILKATILRRINNIPSLNKLSGQKSIKSNIYTVLVQDEEQKNIYNDNGLERDRILEKTTHAGHVYTFPPLLKWSISEI